MSAHGVIAESIVSFKITWKNPGNGKQPIWDQTKQSIELHETDVYPDLEYTSAYGTAFYKKYTSGALLNELIVAINSIIDKKIGKVTEANLPPGKQQQAIGPSGTYSLQKPTSGHDQAHGLLTAPVGKTEPEQGALPVGPEPAKQLGGPSSPGEVNPADNGNTNEPERNDQNGQPNDDGEEVAAGSYIVTVYGDKLRLLDVQTEAGGYTSGIKFIYYVSDNLAKVVNNEKIDNQSKIWAEINVGGLTGKTIKLKFEDFKEEKFKFGGNLLAQILPNVELGFIPSPNSAYTKEKPEADLADVMKAADVILHNKSDYQVELIKKKAEEEIERRKSDQVNKKNGPVKQSKKVENK